MEFEIRTILYGHFAEVHRISLNSGEETEG